MYKIQLTNKFTCLDIEQELGLERGAVMQVSESPDGTINVYLEHEPTADQKAALQAMLNMKITSEGAD